MRRTIVGLYAALLAGSLSVAQAQVKIGVVSAQRLYTESVQARAANEILTREFDARFADLQKQEKALQDREAKLTKDAATMTEMQKSAADKELRDGVRDLQAKRAAFEDDLEVRKQDENARLARVLEEEILTFAKAQGYDLILAEGVLYADGALDITNALLQALQNRKPGAAPATPAAGAPAPARKPATPPAPNAKP